MFYWGEIKELEEDTLIKDITNAFEEIVDFINQESGGLFIGQKQRFHDMVQDELTNLAQQYGFHGQKEYFVERLGIERNGKIDVAWHSSNGVEVVIEIDSIARKKSVDKLLNSKAPHKIWLFYGIEYPTEYIQEDTKKEIKLIHFPIHVKRNQ